MSKLKLKKKRDKFKMDGEEDGLREIMSQTSVSKMEYGNQESKMVQRAISSAQKHKIKLEAGRPNNADGNCSYESIIFNINDRKCFKKILSMSPDFYRRIWNVDLMNKILDNRIPWNPGMTRAEISEGFHELIVSGVYERSYFGDMMMAGIACGVHQRILIFNTNENITATGHDPISVVDPRDYGGDIDTEIPVVVAYNLVHYESLHPVDDKDIEETVKLTNSYTAHPSRYKEEYGFTSKDMPYLVSSSPKSSPQKVLRKKITDQSIPTGNPKRPNVESENCLLYTSPSPRDGLLSRMPSSA